MATITESTLIKGVQIVEPQAFGDSRGTFIETYRREWFPLGRIITCIKPIIGMCQSAVVEWCCTIYELAHRQMVRLK